MEAKICEERHKKIDQEFSRQERRLNSHSDELDLIKVNYSRLDEKLLGVIEQLKNLVSVMKWFIGLMVASFIGFFFYVVQTKIF